MARTWLGLMLALGLVGGAHAETLTERGRYLVNGILACGNCHTPKAADGTPLPGSDLAGGLRFHVPPFEATASNITPDPETGIGGWSAADIKRALVEGIRPDHARLGGTPLAAIMPAGFYKAMLPRDLDAVAAYLGTLPAVRNATPDPVYKMPAGHQSYPDAERGFTEADLADPVRRGAYLATLGHCMECHSPRERGQSDYGAGLGRGGGRIGPEMVTGVQEGWGGVTVPNITPHPTAGIGRWTDAEIKRAITSGVRPDGRRLGPPMAFAWYATMTETDLDAIVAWLRTIPPRE